MSILTWPHGLAAIGALLQMLGFVLAFIELRGIQRTFGEDSRNVHVRPRIGRLDLKAVLAASGAGSESHTVEERLDQLERNQIGLRDETQEGDSRVLEKTRAERAEDLQALETATGERIEHVNVLLRNVALIGLGQRYLALALFFIGLVLQTIGQVIG